MFRIVSALFAIVSLAGPVSAQAPDPIEEACLTAVIGLGAKADVDPKLDAPARVAAQFETIDDATLAAVGKLPCVGSLKIDNAAKVTEKGLAALRELPNLQVLVLGQSGASDKEAAVIGGLKTVQTLYLGQSRVTDAGLAGLKPLKWLKSLDLYDTRTGDAGLKHLAGFAELQALNLSGTRVTDKGLVTLAEIKTLKAVQLFRTDATRAGIMKLEEAIPKIVVRN